MKFQLLLLLSFLILSTSTFAQESPKVYRPDIPGQLLVDWGVNGTYGAPEEFKKGWFGSRTVNVYYYFPIRIAKSKFTVTAGLGFGMDRFKFTNFHYLTDTLPKNQTFELVPNLNTTTNVVAYPGMKKSLLSMTYLDIPLEVRYNLNPDDLNRTFWIGIGGRAGLLVGANSKIKYSLDGNKIVSKVKYPQGLNPFRYGATLRVGIGNFNFFGFYNLSPLFEQDKGPSATQMTTWTVGISLTGL